MLPITTPNLQQYDGKEVEINETNGKITITMFLLLLRL